MIRTEMCMDAVKHVEVQAVILASTLAKFYLLSFLNKYTSQRHKQSIYEGSYNFNVLAVLNCAFLITCLFGRRWQNSTTF